MGIFAVILDVSEVSTQDSSRQKMADSNMDDEKTKKLHRCLFFFFSKNMFMIRTSINNLLLPCVISCSIIRVTTMASDSFSVLEPLLIPHFQPSLGKQELECEEKY